MVDDFLVSRQSLIQIRNSVGVFVEQFRFARSPFPRLDQIQNVYGRSISIKKIVEVEGGCAVEWIDQVQLNVRLG